MVDRREPEAVTARVDESVRRASRGDHDVAGLTLHLRVIDEERPGAGMDDEDLFVRVAVQIRTMAVRNVDQNQRQFSAVVVANEVAGNIAAWQVARVGQEIHTVHCNRQGGGRAVSP